MTFWATYKNCTK